VQLVEFIRLRVDSLDLLELEFQEGDPVGA